MKRLIKKFIHDSKKICFTLLLIVVFWVGTHANANDNLSHVDFNKSTSSFNQTDVDRAKHLLDNDGVPYLLIENIGKQSHPAWVAIYALAYAGVEVYDERLNGIDDDSKFKASIDWLEKNLIQNERDLWVWHYHFDSTYNDITIKAPWSSAFAQATGIQALLVAYERTGERRYIDLAQKAAQSLFTPLRAGGFLFEVGADIWFEEIPEPIDNPGHILNGHMRVLLALADLYKATNDDTISTWLQRGTDTLYRWLPKFDTGYWLRYDLNPRKEDLLFRFANPYGFPAHALAIGKITLRDPVSKAEVTVDIGSELDAAGGARIAGVHWGQIEEVAGRSARKLIPAMLDNPPDEMGAPHSYFYLKLPTAWKDNLRDQWHELIIEYYDDAMANITVQQRSIAPGQTFRDIRDGDLHLTGAGHWRKWIVPVRSSDLGHWVGTAYASKHTQYLEVLSQTDKRFTPWSMISRGYLAAIEPDERTSKAIGYKAVVLPKQTPPLHHYSLDDNGVVMRHADSESRILLESGEYSGGGRGTPGYWPFVIAQQALLGDSFLRNYSSGIDRSIEREPALEWLMSNENFVTVGNASVYQYPVDNAYNDVSTVAPWPSAFGQAYVLKALATALREGLGEPARLSQALQRAINAFRVSVADGGITTTDEVGSMWFEEVPNKTHILNAHLVSISELASAARALSETEPRVLADIGIKALREKLHLFDTGYWLRYGLNPKKEILLQIDWLNGDRSPLIDEIFLENPQTGHRISLNLGTAGDFEGAVRISGAEWRSERIVDGRTVRDFANGYQIRSDTVQGGVRHNVIVVPQLPDHEFHDFFDVPAHRLVIRYKDVGEGTFGVKTQAIHEGNELLFVPIRGGLWHLQGDQQWKEAVFTIRPQDMGWYKGEFYQKYEVAQLQRIANLTNDWFFYQYADRHRHFLALQRDGVAAIVEGSPTRIEPPLILSVIDASNTYPGHGFDNSVDGDPEDNYTAGLENDHAFLAVELDREASLDSIVLHWESELNRADYVLVRELLVDGSIGRTLAEGSPGRGLVGRMRFDSGPVVSRLRIDFGAFAGQARILLRQITAVEVEGRGSSSSPRRWDSTPYLDGNDPENPLNVFRTPISNEMWRLSERLSLGAMSDHEKILRFMDYIDQFRVGIDGDGSPDSTVQNRVGACGTFTGTLLALAASQGMQGRYINLMNYPEKTGHTIAEIYLNGKWNVYDPTFNAFYTAVNDESLTPLSFEELRSLYATQPSDVRLIARTYRVGFESFTGAGIFNNADPVGVIGVDRPKYYPLYINLELNPVLLAENIGLSHQGSNYLGAAGINQNHKWTIDGLTSGESYVFVVHPEHIGGDLNANELLFELNLSMERGVLAIDDQMIIDFSASPVTPIRIPFEAMGKSVELIISHPYRGPDFRYFSVLGYEIRQLRKD